MIKKLSLVAISALTMSFQVYAGKPNSCLQAVEKCQKKLSRLQDQLSKAEAREDLDAISRLEQRIQDVEFQCQEDVQDACS